MAKKYLIIGLGHFGFYLAKLLYEKGEEVVVIDSDEKAIRKITPHCSKALTGNVMEREILEKVEPKDMDRIVVCIGEHIEASLMAVQYLHDLGVQKDKIYAKATSKEHKEMLNKIGVDRVIFPEEEMAKKFAFILRNEWIREYFSVENGYGLVEIPAPSSFLNKTIEELQLRARYNVIIVGIKNLLERTVEWPPSPTHKIKSNETLIIAGKEEDIEKLIKEAR